MCRTRNRILIDARLWTKEARNKIALIAFAGDDHTSAVKTSEYVEIGFQSSDSRLIIKDHHKIRLAPPNFIRLHTEGCPMFFLYFDTHDRISWKIKRKQFAVF